MCTDCKTVPMRVQDNAVLEGKARNVLEPVSIHIVFCRAYTRLQAPLAPQLIPPQQTRGLRTPAFIEPSPPALPSTRNPATACQQGIANKTRGL